MKFIYLSLVLAFLSSGCTTMPGDTTISTSKFDGSKEASMEPAWVDESGTMKLGLFKSTRMETDKYVLKVVLPGIHSFGTGKNFHVKIDGKLHSFESQDKLTNIVTEPGSLSGGIYTSPTSQSSKDYTVTEKFLEEMLAAKEVLFKVELNKTYVEGVLKDMTYMSAKKNMPDFIATIKNGFVKPVPNRATATTK